MPAFPLGQAAQSALLSCLEAKVLSYLLYFPVGQLVQKVLATILESLYLPLGQTAQTILSAV